MLCKSAIITGDVIGTDSVLSGLKRKAAHRYLAILSDWSTRIYLAFNEAKAEGFPI